MRVLLVDNRTKYFDDLKWLLSQYDVSTIDYLDLELAIANEYQLVVFSGGGEVSITTRSDWHSQRAALLRALIKPFIGICYGCELLAHAYGTELKLIERVKGVETIKVKEGYGFSQQEYRVYENHRFCIPAVSDEFEALAYSSQGIEILKHRDKPHWGLQFHPEVREPANDGEQIFREILTHIM